jgi:superfamily II DNA or RNA helicase
VEPGRRGRQFEQVCAWFLATDAVYRSDLRRVWAWDEWPGRWGADAGIDLVAEDRRGGLWAIQAKAYDPQYSVTKADVDTFLSESARSAFTFRLLIATTNRIGQTARRTIAAQEKPASLLLLGDLERSQVEWPRSVADLRPRRPKPKRPRVHQREAIRAVCRGFGASPRGQLIMACGTGKTLAALFITEKLAAQRTLVLVPSLSLLAQTLREWTANAKVEFDFLAVCSDDTVVQERDAPVANTSELGLPVTSDPHAIASFLRSRGRHVIFATYQSSPRIADAYSLGRVPMFDLVVADEAHRCAGRVSRDFATVLDANAIRARRRLFMTATPRYFTGRVVREARDEDFEVASMDDENRFGPIFHRLSFGEAIDRDLLTDYQVAIIGVDDATYRDWAERGRFVTTDGIEVTDARTLAGQIGVAKAIRKYDLRRTITFHSRVAAARRFSLDLPAVINWMPTRQRPPGALWCGYASGEMSSGERDLLLGRLRHLDGTRRGLLANARCLAEGVDVPALDGVAFIDPRRSEVEIVQAVGRAIRKAEAKEVGTIVLPVFISATDDPEIALDDSAFKPVWDVLKALRAHDEVLAEQLDSLRRQLGRGNGGRLHLPAKIKLDLPARVSIAFAAAFDTRVVERTTADWEFAYGKLQRYVAQRGDARVPASWIDDDGYALGEWVGTQRAAKERMTPNRSARLEAALGWVWDANEAAWQAGLKHLLDYWSRNHDTLVPANWVDIDGYALGFWVGVQRFKRGALAADRVACLEAIPGWVWDPHEAQWEEGLARLTAYIDRHHHARVPKTLKTDGYALATWVAWQRRVRDTMPVDRVQRLEAIPEWVWVPRDARWEAGLAHLKEYAALYGTARVPVKFHDDGFDLGRWVNAQRTHRARLAPDRVARLEAVPGWAWAVKTAGAGRPHLALPDDVRTRIADERAAGVTLAKIADSLNREGVSTGGRGRWYPSTVRAVLPAPSSAK